MRETARTRNPPMEVLVEPEIAVLDEHGRIVAVNRSWEAFALYNGGDPGACGVGASYLEACDAAGGDPHARAVADLIRAAVRGDTMTSRSLVIPCHLPAEERWFELFVSPRVGCPGATVMLRAVDPPAAPGRVIDITADVQVRHDEIIGHLHAAGLILNQLGRAHPAPAISRPLGDALAELDAAIDATRRAALEARTRRARRPRRLTSFQA